jgi:polypeptide N-acetylgalactosaminyltransferase
LYQENGFNAIISDKISLQRSVQDLRPPECQKRLYLERLPAISVIIPFYDEHFRYAFVF